MINKLEACLQGFASHMQFAPDFSSSDQLHELFFSMGWHNTEAHSNHEVAKMFLTSINIKQMWRGQNDAEEHPALYMLCTACNVV